MAVANYQTEFGCYPPAYVAGPDGRPWHSWRVLILPFVGEGELYSQYEFSEPWDGPNNRKLAARMPRTYEFHGTAQPGNTVTNYLAVVGNETPWPGPVSASAASVTDAPGETILLVENRGAGVHWMEPRDLQLVDIDLRLNRPAGISSPYDAPAVVMIDSTVHRLNARITPATLRGLLTSRGGERMKSDGPGEWELLKDGRLRPRVEP